MVPYYAGPKPALFLRVVLILAGIREAGVIRPAILGGALLEREYHVFEKLSFFEIW